jgi:1,3-propanediol dehydrogenase
LAQRLNIPEKISQLEILEESYLANLDKMAADALASGSPANTYQLVDQNAIIEIYKKLTT